MLVLSRPPAPQPHLQKRRQTTAKGVTAKAVRDFVVECARKLDKLEREGKLPAHMPRYWSMDRCNVHECAKSDEDGEGMPEGSWENSPPPWSPDLHKVIEHAIGRANEWFRRELVKRCFAARKREHAQKQAQAAAKGRRNAAAAKRVYTAGQKPWWASYPAVPSTIPQFFAVYKEAFEATSPADVVRADCYSLKRTYQAVIDQQGEYPARKNR